MEKKNILIIENFTDHFTAIRKALQSHFNEQISISPISLGDSEMTFNNNNFLLGKITEGDFKGVCDFHKNIDLYIIDVYLINDSDKTGLEFAKFILKNRFDDFKIIIISNNKVKDELINTKNDKIIFFSKFDKGVHNFPNDLAKIAKNVLKIDLVVEVSKASVKSIPIGEKETFGYRCHVAWEYFRDNTNRLIDKFIFIAFYILISFTTIYSMWNILMSIKDSFLKIHYAANEVKEDETLILKTAEHIFLYLLPVFIVFGFFNYYKTNTRITLLDGKTEGNDDENSTKAMNLTKILFISSIISYVIIKVIEIVYFNQENSLTSNRFLTVLISSGILLTLLMAYFIFLDRKKH